MIEAVAASCSDMFLLSVLWLSPPKIAIKRVRGEVLVPSLAVRLPAGAVMESDEEVVWRVSPFYQIEQQRQHARNKFETRLQYLS